VAERTFLAMLHEAKVELRFSLRVDKVVKEGSQIRSRAQAGRLKKCECPRPCRSLLGAVCRAWGK